MNSSCHDKTPHDYLRLCNSLSCMQYESVQRIGDGRLTCMPRVLFPEILPTARRQAKYGYHCQ
jgi:hypothetical protein